jgi:hypothetical protein
VDITTKKVDRIEAETKEEQRILSSNAWHLARYVIEHDYEIIIPEEINIGRFLCWSENYPALKPEEKIKFLNQYTMLEKVTKSVTARTLVATRIHGRGFFNAAFCTSVGKYLLFLSTITLFFVCLLIFNLTDMIEINETIIPFCAAGLGTCVFLLRVTQEKLTTREFDPAFIPSQLIRLGLGILAGGTMVLFPGLLKSGESAVGTGHGIGLELGSIAFILGYAVDIFYALLDNIGGKIKDRNK